MKTAILINGGVGTAMVLMDGKIKEGFTGAAYNVESGKFDVTFGTDVLSVDSLQTDNASDWPLGTEVVKLATGEYRTIKSKGTTHFALRGATGGALKVPEDVTATDLATDYIKASYAAAAGIKAG